MAKKAKEEGSQRRQYRVKDGHTVTHGQPGDRFDHDDGTERSHRVYGAGELVELYDEEADAMPWAVESADGKTATK